MCMVTLLYEKSVRYIHKSTPNSIASLVGQFSDLYTKDISVVNFYRKTHAHKIHTYIVTNELSDLCVFKFSTLSNSKFYVDTYYL